MHMLRVLHFIEALHQFRITATHCTVKNIVDKNTLANLANYSIAPIFTISIIFPMQMDFNSPKLANFLKSYLPNFFIAKVFYYIYGI